MQARLALLPLCLSCALAFAQGYPKAEVFAGYSFTSIDQNSGPRANANGFELSASGNLNERFGLETAFSGYYQQLRDNGGPAGSFSYMAGPRFNLVRKHRSVSPLFVHFLLGFQHLIGSDFGNSVSDTAIAVAMGGGLEWRFSTRLSLRSSVDYALTHYFITQNNVRMSVGVAYAFGGASKKTGLRHDSINR